VGDKINLRDVQTTNGCPERITQVLKDGFPLNEQPAGSGVVDWLVNRLPSAMKPVGFPQPGQPGIGSLVTYEVSVREPSPFKLIALNERVPTQLL
jgi:hypothetical protein